MARIEAITTIYRNAIEHVILLDGDRVYYDAIPFGKREKPRLAAGQRMNRAVSRYSPQEHYITERVIRRDIQKL